MVLTKSELIASLQNEVRILLHLASKIDRAMLDYRPTPKQRSTIELLKYLSMMGPALVQAAKAGAFDPCRLDGGRAGRRRRATSIRRSRRLPAHSRAYATLLGDMSDADFRGEIEMFGSKTTARRLHRQPRALWMRGLPHAAVPVPEGLRPRGAEHDEPLGRRRCAGAGLSPRRPRSKDPSSPPL